MAEDPVKAMERRLHAGRDYLAALQKLAFRPEAMCWAVSPRHVDMELLVVTSWTDNIGPKAVYDLLFEAYDLAATPREVNPFIVSLFSPQSQVAKDIVGGFYAAKRSVQYDPAGAMIILGMADYSTIPAWVIHAEPPRRATRLDDARRFSAFQRNVEQLAA